MFILGNGNFLMLEFLQSGIGGFDVLCRFLDFQETVQSELADLIAAEIDEDVARCEPGYWALIPGGSLLLQGGELELSRWHCGSSSLGI